MQAPEKIQIKPLLKAPITKPVDNHMDHYFENCIKALRKKPLNRNPEEDADLRTCIKSIAFFHNILYGEEYEHFVRDFAEHLGLTTISPGKAVYHKGELDDNFYLVLKGNVVMYREDTSHSLYESEEFKFQEENVEKPDEKEHEEKFKYKNTAALRDIELLMSEKTKKEQGSLEKMGVPDYRQFDPEKFDVGVSKLIYLMQKYDPKKSKVDPYGPEVDDETKFIYDYSLLFYAQLERPDKYYRAGKFHYRPVRRFRRGEYFGEAGMIVSQPRTETAIAADEVILASIPRKKTLKHFPQIMSVIDYRMMKLIPFFKVINHVYVVKLCAAMKDEAYEHGHMIFKEGAKRAGFFVLIQGEIEIVKDITVNKYLISENHNSMHSDKTRRYLIETIREGQIFGEDDLLFNDKMRYTAFVKSKIAIVIRMYPKMFDNFYKTYPYIFDELYVLAALRNKNRINKVALIKDPTSVEERKRYQYIPAVQPGQSKEYIEKILHLQELEKKEGIEKPKLKIPKPRLKTFFSRLQVPKFLEKMKEFTSNGKIKGIIPLVSVILDKVEEEKPVLEFEALRRESERSPRRTEASESVRSYDPLVRSVPSLDPGLMSYPRLEDKIRSEPYLYMHPSLGDDLIAIHPSRKVSKDKEIIEAHAETEYSEHDSKESIEMDFKDDISKSNNTAIPFSPKFETSPVPDVTDNSQYVKTDENSLDCSKDTLRKVNSYIRPSFLKEESTPKIKLPPISNNSKVPDSDTDTSTSKKGHHLRLGSLLKHSISYQSNEDQEELYSTLRKKMEQLVSPKSSRLFQLTSVAATNSNQTLNSDLVNSRMESYNSLLGSPGQMSPLSPKIKPKVFLSPKTSRRDLYGAGSPKSGNLSDLRLTITSRKKKDKF